MFGARRAGLQKFSATAPRECEIEAACFAMILTACRACDIFARLSRLTLKITAWLKGFCAVLSEPYMLLGCHKVKISQEKVAHPEPAELQARASSLNRLGFSPGHTSRNKSAGQGPAPYPQDY